MSRVLGLAVAIGAAVLCVERCTSVTMWLRLIGPSKYGSENEKLFFIQEAFAVAKAIVVSWMSHAMYIRYEFDRLSSLVAFFCAFEMVDILQMLAMRTLSSEMFFHHIVHIIMCLCFECDLAEGDVVPTLLLMQETSSIFLNVFLVLRNREYSRYLISASFVGFYVCFVLYRGIGGLYVCTLCFQHYDIHLAALVCLGYGLQLYWIKEITAKAHKKLSDA